MKVQSKPKRHYLLIWIMGITACRSTLYHHEKLSDSLHSLDPIIHTTTYKERYNGPLKLLLETLLNRPGNESIKARLSVAASDVAVSNFLKFTELIQVVKEGQVFSESLAKEICNKGGGGSSGEGDAIEHVLLSAYTAQKSNHSDLLERFLNSREIKDKITISELMDLHNNQLGFKLAEAAIRLNIAKQDFRIWIKKEVTGLANQGKLSVNSNQSNLVCHHNQYPNEKYQSTDFKAIACASVPGELVIDGVQCKTP